MTQFFFYKKFSFILKCSVIAGLLFFYSLQNTQAKELKILSTTGMIADILKNLVKHKATHYQMMGSNIDPHTYKPSAKRFKKNSRITVNFLQWVSFGGKPYKNF